MFFNIIMAVSLYPVVLIMFFVYRRMGLNHKKYVFGRTLREEDKKRPEITKITEAYRKQMRAIIWIFMILPVSVYFVTHVSLQYTFWMIWMFGAIFAYMIPFIRANEKVGALQEIWDREFATVETEISEKKDRSETVETEVIRTLRFRHFLFPLGISLLSVLLLAFYPGMRDLTVFELERVKLFLWMQVLFLLITFCFIGAGIWMDRRGITPISGDSSINVAYEKERKMVWKKIWTELGKIHSCLMLFLTLFTIFGTASVFRLLSLVILEGILALLIIFKGVKEMEKIDEAYPMDLEGASGAADDRYWKWGIFYYNPEDKKGIVEVRYGFGTTANMARKSGKATILIGILALFLIAGSCVYLILEDFTPIHISIKEERLVCEHLREEYVISLDEIQEVTLLTELPKGGYKSVGTATDTLEKGSFVVPGYGKVYEFLNPENDAFLYIETENRNYIICGSADQETMEVYEKLAP